MSVLASAVPDDIFVIAAHKLVSLVGYYVRKKRYVCTDWPQRYEDILVIGAHEPLSHVGAQVRKKDASAVGGG